MPNKSGALEPAAQKCFSVLSHVLHTRNLELGVEVDRQWRRHRLQAELFFC